MSKAKKEESTVPEKTVPEKQPGRPAGSPNKERMEIFHIPEVCPRCGSTELLPNKEGIVRTMDVVGERTAKDGRTIKHNRLVWRRRTCKVCDQKLIVLEPQYITKQE
jgi:hypothetical protein